MQDKRRGPGAPSPNPAARPRSPRPRRAAPPRINPLPRQPLAGGGRPLGVGLQPCFVHAAPHPRPPHRSPSLRRRARGWGGRLRRPPSPTQPWAVAEAQAQSGYWPPAGGLGPPVGARWKRAGAAGRVRGARHPGAGGAPALSCTAQCGGGSLTWWGRRYKYLRIVSSGTGGGERVWPRGCALRAGGPEVGAAKGEVAWPSQPGGLRSGGAHPCLPRVGCCLLGTTVQIAPWWGELGDPDVIPQLGGRRKLARAPGPGENGSGGGN